VLGSMNYKAIYKLVRVDGVFDLEYSLNLPFWSPF
jgi:hypothetical protein